MEFTLFFFFVSFVLFFREMMEKHLMWKCLLWASLSHNGCHLETFKNVWKTYTVILAVKPWPKTLEVVPLLLFNFCINHQVGGGKKRFGTVYALFFWSYLSKHWLLHCIVFLFSVLWIQELNSTSISLKCVSPDEVIFLLKLNDAHLCRTAQNVLFDELFHTSSNTSSWAHLQNRRNLVCRPSSLSGGRRKEKKENVNLFVGFFVFDKTLCM